MPGSRIIRPPLSNDTVDQLSAGDRVLISGIIYTARDAAHKRLVELIRENRPLPVDLAGQIIYYVGPTPPQPGMPIGAAGPTTSYRMDPYAPLLIEKGLKGMIGKGIRGDAVIEAMKRYRAVYFAATGGAGPDIQDDQTRRRRGLCGSGHGSDSEARSGGISGYRCLRRTRQRSLP
jgi:fumarate hydratase subunit beta